MIGFFDSDENEYYFLFILFVSYVKVFFTYVRGLVTPTGQGFPSPLFLGVAIGLELRIRLWHMFWLAFVAVGVFAYVSLRKLFSPFRVFFHCTDILSCWLLRKSCTPGLSFFSLPSFRRAGWRWAVSGCPCVASRGFFLSSCSIWSNRRGGGASVRAFDARELASVSSVHSWTGGPGVALAADSCYLFCPGWLSLLISARSARWWGRRVFGAFFSLFSVASPASSLHARRGGEASECRSS